MKIDMKRKMKVSKKMKNKGMSCINKRGFSIDKVRLYGPPINNSLFDSNFMNCNTRISKTHVDIEARVIRKIGKEIGIFYIITHHYSPLPILFQFFEEPLLVILLKEDMDKAKFKEFIKKRMEGMSCSNLYFHTM